LSSAVPRQSAGKSVRAVRFTVLPILDPFLTISIYLFSAAVQLPGIEFFREGNLPVPILPMPVFRRE